MIENLSALSGVAYEKLGAIFPFLVAPNPAPTVMPSKSVAIGSQSAKFFEVLIDRHFPQPDFWTALGDQDRNQISPLYIQQE
jgi:hypothetical protein